MSGLTSFSYFRPCLLWLRCQRSFYSSSGVLERNFLRIKDELSGHCIETLQISPRQFSQLSSEFLRKLKHEELPFFTDANRSPLIANNGNDMVRKYLSNAFLDHVSEAMKKVHLKDQEHANILQSTNLRNPAEWFPEARKLKRKIVAHVGPTNSGKTHGAMEALKKAKRGIYCAPLRLLAIEKYEKLNEEGFKCALITGEAIKGPKAFVTFDRLNSGSQNADMSMYGYVEREVLEEGVNMEGLLRCNRQHPALEKFKLSADLICCTVEMADYHTLYDMAIIDEIQMLSDEQRGWAFTHALLGLIAKEIHVCGEPSAIPLLQKICKDTGDELQVNTYQRLAPLAVEHTSLNSNFSTLRKGDCIICFSRRNIFMLKKMIEHETKKKCAVIYGALPMESRTHQAKLFNDLDSDYDILVATDAIGMGLNLNIGRIIFYTLKKPQYLQDNHDRGYPVLQFIEPRMIKQIAGRAGRFNSIFKEGVVTTFEERDLRHLKKALKHQNSDLTESGLFPLYTQVEALAMSKPDVPFHELLEIFESVARVDQNYFLCNLSTAKSLAEKLKDLKAIGLADRYVFVCAPVPMGLAEVLESFLYFATKFSEGDPCPIRIPQSLVVALRGHEDDEASVNGAGGNVSSSSSSASTRRSPVEFGFISTMEKYEKLHKILILYRWLAIRFPKIFYQGIQAEEMSIKLESDIFEVLMAMSNIKALEARPVSPKQKTKRHR